MTRRLVAHVDPDVCTGAQMCTSIAPAWFSYDDEAYTSRFVGEPSDDAAILEAAEGCPVEAITVREADGGEQVFP